MLNDEILNSIYSLLQTRDDKLCMRDEHRAHSHFFSSYFIDKLSNGSNGDAEGDDEADYNYELVNIHAEACVVHF